MANTYHVENIINNASFTATVTSATLTNDKVAWEVLVRVGAMTTTPTLTITINESIDGTNWFLVGSASAINAANTKQRILCSPTFGTQVTGPPAGLIMLPPIVAPFIQVVATFGGSGNFANTEVDLIGVGAYD